jgi:hypothetical protein
MSVELMQYFAQSIRRRHPDWSPEEIGQILTFATLESEAEHLAACQRLSDEQYARQQASARASTSISTQRPEAIATEGPLPAAPKLLAQPAPQPAPIAKSAKEIDAFKEDLVKHLQRRFPNLREVDAVKHAERFAGEMRGKLQ